MFTICPNLGICACEVIGDPTKITARKLITHYSRLATLVYSHMVTSKTSERIQLK
jgi:hypothetical protein